MARGRRPQGHYKGKGSVLSTRITAELREAIEAAAAAKKHSLSQEIEHRLRRSFAEDNAIDERFGGRRNYGALRLIAALMGTFRDPQAWLDDRRLFDRLVRMTGTVLAELRPPGSTTPEDDIERAIRDVQSAERVAFTLLAVRDAAPDLPIDPTDLAAFIKADLGPVTQRIGRQQGRVFVDGTAEDMQRAADDLEAEQEDEGSDK